MNATTNVRGEIVFGSVCRSPTKVLLQLIGNFYEYPLVGSKEMDIRIVGL